MLLLRSVHGSKLYGLSHANSDNDVFEVYSNEIPSPSKSILQTIDGKEDVTRMNLSTFMLYAGRSSHQILELMFSPYADVDYLYDLRANYQLNTATFVNLYSRTIRNFHHKGDKKSKMHACRLHFNLQEGLEYGRFSPVVTDKQRVWLLNSDTSEFDKLIEPYYENYELIDNKWVSIYRHESLLGWVD